MATVKSASTTTSTINPAAAAVGANDDTPVSIAATTVEILCTVAYPQIATPDEKSGKFNLMAIVSEEQSQQALVDLVGNAAEAMFKNREFTGSMHNPLRDADEKNDAGEFTFKHPAFRSAGMVARLKTGFAPKCVWGPNETEIDASEIKGGDECVIEVSAYGFDKKGKGVALSLGRIWLINKGKATIERGSGGNNVQRLDRSNLRFTQVETNDAVEAV